MTEIAELFLAVCLSPLLLAMLGGAIVESWPMLVFSVGMAIVVARRATR